MKQPKPIRPEHVHSLFHELTEDERKLVRAALGHIPTDAAQGDYETLWNEFQGGRVGAFYVRDEAGNIAAISFYSVEKFSDGSKNFASLSTVAFHQTQGLSETSLPQMEALARELGCDSMSLRTVRYGLARKLVYDHGWGVTEIICRKKL